MCLSRPSVRPATFRIRCASRTAFTLLEVVAAMVLTGTLLAFSLTAISRMQVGIANAKRQQVALRALDDIATKYLRDPRSLAVPGAGMINNTGAYGDLGSKRFAWRSQIIRPAILAGIQVNIVRIEIISFNSADIAGAVSKQSNGDAIASVEIMQPVKRKREISSSAATPMGNYLVRNNGAQDFAPIGAIE